MSNAQPNTLMTTARSFVQWFSSPERAVHRKAFCAMTLAAGMTFSSTGCASSAASVMAMASRPSQDPITTDRLMSVGRVFETQQNYGKAKQIYKLVLSQQPNNYEAQQQIAWIDSVGSGIPMPNPRTGQQTPPQTMYASNSQQPPAPAAAPPRRFAPQAIEDVVNTNKPAIPVVISGTDPATGQPYILDSTGALPAETPLPPATLVDSAPAVVQTQSPAMPAAMPAAYPVENFEVSASAAGSVSMTSDGDGQWAMPVSASEQPYMPPMHTPSSDEYEQTVGQPIEQLSGTFDQSVADGGLGPIEQCVENPAGSIPQLTQFLRSSDTDVRSLAAFLIGETGWKGASALPALHDQLANEREDVIRITIAESIAKIDSQSRSAFEVMSGCLASDSVEIRSQAAFAFRVYAAAGHPECVQQLATCMQDPDATVRSMAALSLGDFGRAASAAVPALEAALNDDSADVRDAASAALSRINQQR